MDLSVVATASSVLSNAIKAMKYVREVSDNTDNLELKSRILDLYTSLQEVREAVIDMSEENRQLRAQLEDKGKFIGPVAPIGYYFETNDSASEHPLCPKCLQSEPRRTGFMSQQEGWNGGLRRRCHICGHTMWDRPMS